MTLNDLLDIAIRHEIGSQELYTHLYGAIADPEAKTFLQGLIQEEKTHEDTLLMIRDLEIYDGTIALDDSEIATGVEHSHTSAETIGTDAEIHQILELALQREYHAHQLYVRLSNAAVHAELKLLFEKLAVEEVQHHHNIEKRFAIQKGEMGFEM